MKKLLQTIPVAAVLVLASMSTPWATVIETDSQEECQAQSGGELFFVFNGKCYVNGEGGEVVDRSDIPSFGLCFGRCEADRSCGAPFYDNEAKTCLHYREE